MNARSCIPGRNGRSLRGSFPQEHNEPLCQPGVRLAGNGDSSGVCVAQRCAETLLEMGFGMQAFQELQIDMVDSLFFFFLFFYSPLRSLIRGKKKNIPTPLIPVDSPLHRNSGRDNQGLCGIIAERLLFERAELKGRVFIDKCCAYQPVTMINTSAIKWRKKANR